MNNFYVISYVLGDYLIDDIKVEVYYAPAVVESFYSKKEIGLLIEKKKDKDTLDGIFEIIKSRTSELEALKYGMMLLNTKASNSYGSHSSRKRKKWE